MMADLCTQLCALGCIGACCASSRPDADNPIQDTKKKVILAVLGVLVGIGLILASALLGTVLLGTVLLIGGITLTGIAGIYGIWKTVQCCTLGLFRLSGQ